MSFSQIFLGTTGNPDRLTKPVLGEEFREIIMYVSCTLRAGDPSKSA
jgi:hypothetical protein